MLTKSNMFNKIQILFFEKKNDTYHIVGPNGPKYMTGVKKFSLNFNKSLQTERIIYD